VLNRRVGAFCKSHAPPACEFEAKWIILEPARAASSSTVDLKIEPLRR